MLDLPVQRAAGERQFPGLPDQLVQFGGEFLEHLQQVLGDSVGSFILSVLLPPTTDSIAQPRPTVKGDGRLP